MHYPQLGYCIARVPERIGGDGAGIPRPPAGNALPITRLSTASLISRTYLIVRDPGHYRVASLSRGSYVTNGQRMVAVLAAVASVSDRGVNVQPAQQRPQPAPAGDGENASTQASSLRHGERLQPSLTQRDMWVMRRGRVGMCGSRSQNQSIALYQLTRESKRAGVLPALSADSLRFLVLFNNLHLVAGWRCRWPTVPAQNLPQQSPHPLFHLCFATAQQ
ncbi:MAG: hypothetical protein KatS3mg056_1202 [Chloroflexus sp.]|nr:MAG: hypothetical protein KatS3mg056_1202 [Chloroflexus sp.]